MILKLFLLVRFTLCCLQTQLDKVSSGPLITNYMSDTDDIMAIIAAGQNDFAFTLQSKFKINQEKLLSPGAASFPCFANETLIIQLTKIDLSQNDHALIQLDCKNLQIGQNRIDIPIYDDSGVLGSEANVLK